MSDVFDQSKWIDMGGGIVINPAYHSPDHCPECGAPRGVHSNPTYKHYTDVYECDSYYWYYYGEILFSQSNKCHDKK